MIFNGAMTNLPKYKESTHIIGIAITTADIITHFINFTKSRLCINISMAMGSLKSEATKMSFFFVICIMSKVFCSQYIKNYPSSAANGHPSNEEIAVAKIANSYWRAYQAAVATVLRYL